MKKPRVLLHLAALAVLLPDGLCARLHAVAAPRTGNIPQTQQVPAPTPAPTATPQPDSGSSRRQMVYGSAGLLA